MRAVPIRRTIASQPGPIARRKSRRNCCATVPSSKPMRAPSSNAAAAALLEGARIGFELGTVAQQLRLDLRRAIGPGWDAMVRRIGTARIALADQSCMGGHCDSAMVDLDLSGIFVHRHALTNQTLG